MKINDIIDVFNEAIDIMRERENISCNSHIEVISAWERNIGNIKTADTKLMWVEPNKKPVQIFCIRHTDKVSTEDIEQLIEDNNLDAIRNLLEHFCAHSEKFIDGTYGTYVDKALYKAKA